jgi:hypothetical protein
MGVKKTGIYPKKLSEKCTKKQLDPPKKTFVLGTFCRKQLVRILFFGAFFLNNSFRSEIRIK